MHVRGVQKYSFTLIKYARAARLFFLRISVWDCWFFFQVWITVIFVYSCKVQLELPDLYCLYFSPRALLKLSVRGHFLKCQKMTVFQNLIIFLKLGVYKSRRFFAQQEQRKNLDGFIVHADKISQVVFPMFCAL